MTTNHQDLKKKLRDVFWIGGGSGAGKSTIARRIAAEHGLQHYATDDVMADHAGRTTAEHSPLLHEFIAMDLDQRWVNRSPQEMFETFHWFRGEGFDMIVEDLLQLPADKGVIVDGFRLLPHLVEPLLAEHGQAVWLLPTSEFREAAFGNRDGGQLNFLQKTSDPDRARRNLLERDVMFTERLRNECRSLGLNSIQVDLTVSEDQLAKRVAAAFGL